MMKQKNQNPPIRTLPEYERETSPSPKSGNKYNFGSGTWMNYQNRKVIDSSQMQNDAIELK